MLVSVTMPALTAPHPRVKGVVALLAAKIVGPRVGRFQGRDQPPVELRGHSSVLTVLGTFLLTVGWFGFNLGSIRHITRPGAPRIAAQTAVCTSLSGCAGCLAALGVSRCRRPRPSCECPHAPASSYPSVCELGSMSVRRRTAVWSLEHACNGWLAGLVSITACASVVGNTASLVIGALGGLIYYATSLAAARVATVGGPRRAGQCPGLACASACKAHTDAHEGRRTSMCWLLFLPT